MIKGFKCFDKGLVNRFGEKMELGKKYVLSNPPIFKKDGYHMCTNLEDTLRYFDGVNNEIDICSVIGYPEYVQYNDEYYGYYDMYCCQKILLERILTREKIINIANSMNDFAFKKFSRDYKLTKEELEYFKNKYRNKANVLDWLIYCYENKDIYKERIK